MSGDHNMAQSHKHLEREIQKLRSRVAELERMQYDLIRSGALVAIEKCKNASGQRRAIDLYVSANQIAEDIVNATIAQDKHE